MSKLRNLLYKNIYSYDIPSCHYNILLHSDYDISHIDPTNKFERNKAIGIMMRGNKELTKFLRTTTKDIIDFYILGNKLNTSDVILRQYDGFYSTKSLNLNLVHNFPVSLEFKNLYDIFVFSENKKMYLGFDCCKNDLLIKGIPSRYDEIDKIYKKILNINFMNIKSIIQSFKKIKKFVIEEAPMEFYMMPLEDDTYKLLLEEFGEVNMTRKAIKLIDVTDLDRKKYFQIYFEPFFKSIIHDIL